MTLRNWLSSLLYAVVSSLTGGIVLIFILYGRLKFAPQSPHLSCAQIHIAACLIQKFRVKDKKVRFPSEIDPFQISSWYHKMTLPITGLLKKSLKRLSWFFFFLPSPGYQILSLFLSFPVSNISTTCPILTYTLYATTVSVHNIVISSLPIITIYSWFWYFALAP